MSRFKFSPALLSGILVAAFSAIAVWIRCLPYDKVFSGDWIKYTSSDAYFQMRLVDNMVYNYPKFSTFDPYLLYPGGADIHGTHMFVRILASIASLFGLVQPTQQTIDTIAVFFPTVLAVLTIIAVYIIGKELFGRWAGVLAAALLATLPGEFLGRSKLGFTDYHVAEVFLTSITMMFIILAIKAANKAELNFTHIIKLDWVIIRKPLIYSVLGGLFFGLYGLTWTGAPMFVFIIFIYLVIQFVIDHLKKRSNDYLSIIGIITLVVTLLVLVPGPQSTIIQPAIIIVIIALTGLSLISRTMTWKSLKPSLYPVTLLVLGVAAAGIFYCLFPSLVKSMLDTFTIFVPTKTSLTVSEMQPLIHPEYPNPIAIAWNNYTTSFFFGFISLAILVYLTIKHGTSERTLFLVWSLVILIANLGQRRFGYYYSINVTLLTGYLAWITLERVGFREFSAETGEAVKQAAETVRRKVIQKKNALPITTNHFIMSLAVIVVFFVVFFWNIEPARETASRVPFAPSDAWYDSLTWMRENTPEPFGDPEAYYNLETSGKYLDLSTLIRIVPNPSGDPEFYYSHERYYPYPDSAYGVLAWWDYGYWITRIARRLPNANPGQDPRSVRTVGAFFTSQDEDSANMIIEELDSDYVIIDHMTANVYPEVDIVKYPAIITRTGLDTDDYFGRYLMPHPEDKNSLMLVPLFYPEFYRSMTVRLYYFDCKEAIPENVWVISYEERADESGYIYRLVTSADPFPTYEEAEEFRLSKNADNYRIVSITPRLTCTPLEKLEHYELVHSSNITVSIAPPVIDGAVIPEVKIFRYID